MHTIEPYYSWLKYYDSSQDERSPFFGKDYNYELYQNTVYGFFVDPGWDSFESETLYLKILYADYDAGCVIIEFLGEWNDAINNDIMNLKRNVIELLLAEGITKFILIGENVMNFHGSDDSYYEEWFDEIGDGWIIALSFPAFVREEMERYGINVYINMGEIFHIENWRTLKPGDLYELLDGVIRRRLY